MNSLTYWSRLKKDLWSQLCLGPKIWTSDRHNPESASKITADPRSTMFSKSANPLDLPHKSTICALFKSKSVDPKTYSPPSSKVERTVILVKKSDLLWGIWLSEQFMYQFLMYQSNRSFNIPPSRATPWAFEFFENFCSYSTSHWAEKLSKYPHPQKNYQITVLTFQ